MQTDQPKGPFCQSCGIPLQKPQDFATSANGSSVNDYCHFCFQNGAFTQPDMNMQGMIDKCASIMARQGMMSEGQAKALMTDVIPRLKRWQKK